MAVVCNKTQHSSAPVSYSPAPFTIMHWFERRGNIYDNEDSLGGLGHSNADTEFINSQIFYETNARAISFVPFANSAVSPAQAANASDPYVPDLHFYLAEFNGTNMTMQVDATVSTPTAYDPDSTLLDILTMWRTPQQTIAGRVNGAGEHFAVWRGTLTAGEKAALLNQTINPADVQSANLITYRPLVSDLVDVVGDLTWTDVGLASPVYVTSNVSYPAPAGSTYTVTYNGNSQTTGTAPTDPSSPYDANDTVTVLTNSGTLARTGYTFNGWNAAADGSGAHYAVNSTFSINGNITLYAEWASATATMTYNGNGSTGGTAPTDSSSPYTINATVTVMSAGTLVRTGYTFNGWNTAANGSGATRVPTSTFSISANTTLYAQWLPDSGTHVTIDHTNFNPASRSNDEIIAAAALNVFFAHASTGGYIVGPTSLWPYDGLAALASENARYTSGRVTWETPTAPVPSWYASNNGLGDYYFGNTGYVAKIADFRARLAANTRALANVLDVAMMKFCWIDSPDPSTWGTGYSAATMFAAYRDAMLAEEALSPSLNYVWFTAPVEITGSQGVHDYNVLVRNYCTANNKWLFDIADIECHNDAGVKQVDGNGYEILTAAYANDAWGHPNAAGSLKLARAYWSLLAYIANGAPATTYNVTYDGNSNDSGAAPTDSTDYAIGATATAAANSGTLARTGYTFNGWNTLANGTGTHYAVSGTFTVNEDVTLYAEWSAVTYNITYDGNSNTGGAAPAAQTKTYGVALTLATNSGSLVRSGYTFSGWNTAANGTGTDYAVGASYTGNAALSLYAKWAAVVVTRSVTYDANEATSGALPVESNSPYADGATVTVLDQNSLARAGYTFNNWNTAANGSGTAYAPNATFTITADTTLYAQWSLIVIQSTGGLVMSLRKNFTGESICIPTRCTTVGTTRNSMNEMGLLQQYQNTAAAYFPAAAAKVEVSPTAAQDIAAGTGAQKVLICGLDANYDFQYEEIALGATQYAITKTTKNFTRVFSAEVSVAGSGGTNAGPIWFTVDGLGGTYASGVPGTRTSCWMSMGTGFGSCTSGIYTVPRGRKARLESLMLGARTQVAEFFVFSHKIGSAADNALQLEFVQQLANTGVIQLNFPKDSALLFQEKTDIILQASSTTAAAVIGATMNLRWIVD